MRKRFLGDRARWPARLGLLAVVLFAIQPLWGPVVKGHDVIPHFYRIATVHAIWREGLLFSRWAPNLVLGYGYPFFNFYPPLSVYLHAILYWIVGQDAPVAFNVGYALVLALTALGMYGLGRHLFGRPAGLIMAAIYTLSPVVLDHTYARGSFSNALALAVLPLALWLLLRSAEGRGPRAGAAAALVVAALPLSHIAAGFQFLVPLAVMVTVYVSQRRPRHLGAALAPLFLGLALAAFMWLPAVGEIRLTKYAAETSDLAIDAHWANLATWPRPIISGLNNADLPKQLGLLPFLTGLLGGAAAWRRRERPQYGLALVSWGLGLGALFLATAPSAIIWDAVPALRAFQFPWRFLDPALFCLTIAAGPLVSRRPSRPLARLLFIIAGVGILFAQALPYLYPPRLTELERQPTLVDVQRAQLHYWMWGLTAWGEYSYAAVTDWPTAPPFPEAALGAPLFAKLRRSPIPPDAVAGARGTPWRADLIVDLQEPNQLTFDSHYFPGWRAQVDGDPAPAGPDAQGLLTVPVPAGRHEVSVWFGDTPIRTAAEGISLVALLILLMAVAWGGGSPAQNDRIEPDPPADWRQWLLPGALILVILAKVGLFDRVDTPIVRHPTATSVPGTTAPVVGDFGPVSLIGFTLDTPGDLTLYWRAQESPEDILAVWLELQDARGVPVAQIVNRTPGDNVTTTWQAGQLTRDAYQLPLAPDQRPAGYRVVVGLQQAATGAPLLPRDAPDGGRTIQLDTGPRLKLAPLATEPEILERIPGLDPIGATFADAVTLAHAGVAVTQGTLRVTLVWQALAPLPADYTVFIHLLDADGHLVLAGDGPPTAGVYPTSFWERGEIIVDEHVIPLGQQPGAVTVRVGLYQPGSGARLPVTGGQPLGADGVSLGQLRLP